ncbi:MAG: DUF5106 domain-containing protein [Bacteroidota bacterium]
MQYLFYLGLPLVGLLACGASGQTPADEPVVSGNTQLEMSMRGVPSGGKAYLIGVYTESRFRLDSAEVIDGGKAVFSSNSPYPYGFYFAYFPDGSSFQFLMDGDQEFSMSTTKGDVVGAMQVVGNQSNEWLYETLRFEAGIQPRFTEANNALSGVEPSDPNYAALKARQDELVAERDNFLQEMFSRDPNNFFVKFKQAGQNPRLRTELTLPDGSPDNDMQVYYYRREFWDNVDFSDTALIRTPVVANKLDRYMTRLTPKNADSVIASADFLLQKVIDYPEYLKYFANWITLKYEPGETTLMDGEAVYVHMIQNYFTYDLAFWSDSLNIQGLQQRANEMSKSLLKQQAPDVSVPDQNGTPQRLYDETAPYVAVFMYNPTCDHCIEQTPQVRELARRRPDLKIYGIAIDTDREAWLSFVDRMGISDWTNVFDPSNRSIYGTYYVDHTPELYLLNPDRIIIGKNLKANQVEEVIRRDQENR